MTVAVASAPGKIILFGEHGVNRGQPAIAGAIDRRVLCRATTRSDAIVTFSFEDRAQVDSRNQIVAFRRQIDSFRAKSDLDQLCQASRTNFFAPARYVLGHLIERLPTGIDVTWRSDLPIGSGLGSGAAACAAMVRAVASIYRIALPPTQIAWLAWQGDVIAHGGVASGLDSSACALGGLIRYSVAEGPSPLGGARPITVVIGDTRVRADTATINARVRRRLDVHPAYHHLFAGMGLLVQNGLTVLDAGDLVSLGRLMNLNQLVLEKLGVSSAEIETLTATALTAGALGAKLSGSGGGGIIVAVAPPGTEGEVATAIERAGGTALIATLGAPGARAEPAECWPAQATSSSAPPPPHVVTQES